ncbi:MAG TPA: hypothetical protein VGM86_17330 [Thermoanaerobaculia bacterium]|jgi:hypothetical protein
MLGSSVLEVAIGIVFIYLVLSMICTTINEGFATIVNKRGTNLFEGIKNLLNDPAFTGLAQQIYSHGLVDGISQNAIDPAKTNRLPSYMSSKTFAMALLDILGTHGVVAAAQGDLLSRAEKADDEYRAEAAKTPPDAAAVQAKKDAADQAKADLIAAEAQARAAYERAQQDSGADSAAVAQARQALDAAGAAVKMLAARQAAVDASDNPKDAQRLKTASDTLETALVAGRTLVAELPNQLANFQEAVRRLPEGHTKEALFVLIAKAKREATSIDTQVVHLRQEVEGWFNEAMDRVGGWYKRWTQRILLIIAFVLVLVLNTDTLLLVQHLSTEKDLRASILEQAQKTGSFDQVPKQLDTLSLPLGWSLQADNDRRIPFGTAQGPWYLDIGFALKKLLGLLLTMGAISLGAPFWFDTLSKFMNLRGAGTPPGEKTKSAPQSQAA